MKSLSPSVAAGIKETSEKAIKFLAPRKHRGKDKDNEFLSPVPNLVAVLRMLLQWYQLSQDDQFYFACASREDLDRAGIELPDGFLEPPAETVMRALFYNHSETFRIIADFIDALNAHKGDRGKRLLASIRLFSYAFAVHAGRAEKLDWRKLKQEFCGYYEADQNWQKFLRERGIPFKKVGRFHCKKRVQKSRKNTRSPH
jgi:hypothetical protein